MYKLTHVNFDYIQLLISFSNSYFTVANVSVSTRVLSEIYVGSMCDVNISINVVSSVHVCVMFHINTIDEFNDFSITYLDNDIISHVNVDSEFMQNRSRAHKCHMRLNRKRNFIAP